MSGSTAYAAVDLGAESGRIIVGRLHDSRIDLELACRFPNIPVTLPDGLHWNPVALFGQVLSGLGAAAAGAGGLRGVGVDAWGVDYALLDADRRMLGVPFHYRDARTNGSIARAHERISRGDLYAVTGIQTIPINTVFQLVAEEYGSALESAAQIALIPDLISFWLTGELVNEATAASTTGLLDARSGYWAREVISQLGIPLRPFAIDPVEPGVTLGSVLRTHAGTAGPAAGVDVHLVAGHDTASAFAAAPLRGEDAAILSSGTWSLLGIELEQPVLTDLACAYNISNERGIEGTRFVDVSEATGVPIASLQYYFGSREDLLVAAFRHGSSATVAQIRAALEPISDPTERILYVIDVHRDMYDREHDRSVLLSEEFYRLALRDPDLQLDLLDEYSAWRGMIADAVRLGIDAGQFAPETDPDRAAMCLYAFMEGICQPMSMGDPALPKETVRELINEYMGIVLPAPSSGPSTAPLDRPRRVRS